MSALPERRAATVLLGPGLQYHLGPRQLKWPRLLDNVRVRVALYTLTAMQCNAIHGHNRSPGAAGVAN